MHVIFSKILYNFTRQLFDLTVYKYKTHVIALLSDRRGLLCFNISKLSLNYEEALLKEKIVLKCLNFLVAIMIITFCIYKGFTDGSKLNGQPEKRFALFFLLLCAGWCIHNKNQVKRNAVEYKNKLSLVGLKWILNNMKTKYNEIEYEIKNKMNKMLK